MMMADHTPRMYLTENAINDTRTNHIDVACHFSSKHAIRKSFTLFYVPSNDNTANLITKAWNCVAHYGHTQGLELSEWERVLRHSFCAVCRVHTSIYISLMSLFFRYIMTLFFYLMWLFFFCILSVSIMVVQFIALHHTSTNWPVLILLACFTYVVSIYHTVLFHITWVLFLAWKSLLIVISSYKWSGIRLDRRLLSSISDLPSGLFIDS